MTYQTFGLLAFNGEPTAAELEAGLTNARRLYRYEGWKCISTYDLIAWANEHGLQVHYVDGAWVRVPAERHLIAALLRSQLAPDEIDQMLDASTARGERLVVYAEEF